MLVEEASKPASSDPRVPAGILPRDQQGQLARLASRYLRHLPKKIFPSRSMKMPLVVSGPWGVVREISMKVRPPWYGATVGTILSPLILSIWQGCALEWLPPQPAAIRSTAINGRHLSAIAP
jgi:hypothetical protein